MDGMQMTGTPWLTTPVQLHGSRDYECGQNSTAECDYYQHYWHFWYEADHVFALPTVAFFTATILLFAAAHLLQRLFPSLSQQSPVLRRLAATTRYLSYRTFRLEALNWNSAPLGVLLLGLAGTLYFMCMTLVPQPYYWPVSTTLNYWGGSPPLATRSGWLSLGCMPFVFLTAGKSNFITAITGISHERLQVFHRWISYAFFVTALFHTFPFIVYSIRTHQMVMQWNTNLDYWTGVVALLAQAWLTFASMSPLRNMSYEWFKFSHFVAALVFAVFLFIHCAYTLTSWDYFIVTGLFFALSWLHRQTRVWAEHGVHRARLSMATDGFIRVKIPTKAVWHIGQHFFVRFMSTGVHALTIHPFTACSLPSQGGQESELILYIRPREGLTSRLAKQAVSYPERAVRVLLDGPYGGIDMHDLQQCGRQLIIAGGSGAGWLLPMISACLRTNDQLSTTKKGVERTSLRVVLATREAATCHWFEETVREILNEHGRDSLPENIDIELYYTGAPSGNSELDASEHGKVSNDLEKVPGRKQELPKSGSDSISQRSSDSRISHQRGRPNLPALMLEENSGMNAQDAQLGVFVCGTLSMQSDVSTAVAAAQVSAMQGSKRSIHLHMEHFSWA
ncbi:hypothetical protein LTR62_006120 [Meristemomyces frigidus]|uniref:FAD-binding FR-type domain-containing protein n=1 Tax=Meristemomyces frigidus TaxID=1508187 RepID=A0AAN7TNS5_9PEZI|nr:hypothetical protein LTR62_006120 [Meristemomyces frigidus]